MNNRKITVIEVLAKEIDLNNLEDIEKYNLNNPSNEDSATDFEKVINSYYNADIILDESDFVGRSLFVGGFESDKYINFKNVLDSTNEEDDL